MNKEILKGLEQLALEHERFIEHINRLQALVAQEEREAREGVARSKVDTSSIDILTIDDASILLGLSKSRVYALCSQRDIPHYKQGKLYFKRKELEVWMTAKRVSTQAEIESKASLYCHTH